MIYDLTIDYISGYCPVQAEGTLNGLPFYFRARGDSWSFGVGEDPVGASMGQGGWRKSRKYGEWPDAGWVDHRIARILIEECAEEYAYLHKNTGP